MNKDSHLSNVWLSVCYNLPIMIRKGINMANEQEIHRMYNELTEEISGNQEVLFDGATTPEDVLNNLVIMYINLFKEDSVNDENMVALMLIYKNVFEREIDAQELYDKIVYFYNKLNESNNQKEENSLKIDNMNGYEFEKLISNLLEKMGLEVFGTKASGDGGIDFIANSNQAIFGGKYIIQCKRWKSSIGEPILRDLYGVVTSERANKGILITDSYFTSNAIEFANRNSIELIDGEKLNQLLTKYELINEIYYNENEEDHEEDHDEELSYIKREIRNNPENIKVRVKLVHKLFEEIKSLDNTETDRGLHKTINECEEHLIYLVNKTYGNKDRKGRFIKYLSYFQLATLKVIKGDISEGLRYFFKIYDLDGYKDYSGRHLTHPEYTGPYKKLLLEVTINIINLLDLIDEEQISNKIYEKYKSNIDGYLNHMISAGYKEYVELKNKQNIKFINFASENIDEDYEEDSDGQEWDTLDYDSNKSLNFERDLFFGKYSGIFSLEEEGKKKHRMVVKAYM
jgi:restriction endonuclease Mrr